ncbi:hypothetical protein [Hoeflea alexandrii]|uniref:hypothetical protein n=1 Tax=Hoeflea alexandrii TaxID=288436 RepID=UPI0022B07ACF|nr:hypothetical protein [Hoeflea alexandrii]MCZ4288479.1 hypothetical protein [Hoeflea alexandrii]
MTSIKIHPIERDDPDLDGSRLLDAICKTVRYANEQGGIGLTQSKAFNRKFCHWASESFNWKEYSADELLSIQKVLNEQDVMPVMLLHELFVGMRLGRHSKGKFQFNKKAYALIEDKGALFSAIANYYLFEFDHSNFQRRPFVAPGNWDVFLNVINVEAHGGATEPDLLEVLYGCSSQDAAAEGYWHYASFLHWHVLTPLYWIGFLDRIQVGDSFRDRENFYIKTPLWQKCFRLETDGGLEPILVH